MTETNSFAACPTGLGAFEALGIRRGPGSDADPLGMLPAIKAVRAIAAEAGATLIEGLFAAANAMGPVVQSAYETLRDELLDDLRAAQPVNGVVLLLHGAMVAEGCDDCEGALIEKVREIVGASVPIGVALDLHCHLTQRMTAFADLLVAYKEYPHTDIPTTAARAGELTLAVARGEICPVTVVRDCRMIGLWPTNRNPMRGFVERMRAAERAPGIVSVSLAHGMSYGDVPEAGAKLWVVADRDRAQADALAEKLAREFFSLREAISTPLATLDAALDQLAAWAGDRPLAIADVADNPGGGAFGDSSFVLAALLDRGIDRVALGNIWDPGAVQICIDAGVGARFPMRLGGKSGPTAGDPIDVTARVMAIVLNHSQDDFGARGQLGPSAWVRTDNGIDIVLTSRIQQVLGTDLFTGMGIDLAGMRGIVVKSMQHFLASFGPAIGGVVHVDTPGLMRSDYASIPFKHRGLNYWPRVADPFAPAAEEQPGEGR